MSPLYANPNFKPREKFSPSGLSTARACRRKWGYRYLRGLYETEPKKAPTFGSLLHACVEAYLGGATVFDFKEDWRLKKDLAKFGPEKAEAMRKEAPARALAGVPFLPVPGSPSIDELMIEDIAKLDTRKWSPENDPIVLEGRIDLIVVPSAGNGGPYILDHKSTGGDKRAGKAGIWSYALTPETLPEDTQATVYGLATMQKLGLDGLGLRWVYYLTNEKYTPQARPVDAFLTRERAEENAAGLVELALELRGYMRAGAAVEDLPAPVLPPSEDSPCDAFGGCPYRTDRGGPCALPSQNTGALIAAASLTKKKETKKMLPPPPAGFVLAPNPLAPPEVATAPIAAPVEAPVELAEPVALTPKKKARKKKAAAKKEIAPMLADVAVEAPSVAKTTPAPSAEVERLCEMALNLSACGVKRIEFHPDGTLQGIEL